MLRGIYLPRSTDAVAFAMTTYGIPLLVLATTDSASLSGLAFALTWMPRLGAFAFAGVLVDRHGTTAMLRWASTARAAVVLAAATALPAQQAGIGATVIVMVLAASAGLLTECSYIAAETAGGVAARAAGDRAHRVQSVLLGIDQIATLSGPALTGLLLKWTGPAGMLTVLAVFSLLTSFLAPRQDLRPPPTKTQSVVTGLRTGWSTLRTLPALGWLVAGLIVSNLAVGLLQAATPVIIVKQLGHSTADVGFIWSVAAVASLGAIVLCRRAIDRVGLWPVGVLSATVGATACLALSFAGTYYAHLALIACFMAGEGGLTVVLRTLRSHLIPADVFGVTLSLTILLLLLPFPLAGVLVALVPPDQLGHVITVSAVLQALGLLLAFGRLRSTAALRTPLAPTTPVPARNRVMSPPHAPASTPPSPPTPRPSDRAGSRPTLMDRFVAFDAEYPYVYRVLERLTAERIAHGTTRIGLQDLFDDLRWQLPAGVRGLHTPFTTLYARKLLEDHPQWSSAIAPPHRCTS